MNLIFLSLVFKEDAVRLQDVASHAANAWMTGLCGALLSQGVSVRTVGHEPARVWPLGRHLFPGEPEHLSSIVSQRLVRFLNVPLVRQFFLSHGYRKALCSASSGCGETVVCTYNPLPWQVCAARTATDRGARWISFVLDDDIVGLHGWRRYVRQTERASGHVFVSQWAYENAPVRHRFLMEGGVDSWRGEGCEALSTIPAVMFAGLLCEATGVRELLALIDSLPNGQMEFWICGRGADDELAERAKRDRRIKLLGFLSESELDRRLRSAWVLVNPRSVTHEGSLMNFPSKLLRYLSYGKPIVTVWTPGIPAEYREVLQVADPALCGSDPAKIGQAMARQIECVLKWGAVERLTWQEKLHKFVVPNKVWSGQVKRLMAFIDFVVS
jgi:glycosyltransferase involved in cell wall biosynthesis